MSASSASTVLVVSYRSRSLQRLAGKLEKRGHDVVRATTLAEMDERLLLADHLDLALVDLASLEQDIWSRCESLGEAAVPFVLIAPMLSPTVRNAGLSAGARTVLAKPVDLREILTLVDSILLQQG